MKQTTESLISEAMTRIETKERLFLAVCIVCGNASKALEPGFPTCKGCTTERDREQAAEPLFRQHFPVCRFLKSGSEQGPCNCSQWINGEYDVAQRLLNALYTHNWEPRAYSGRGMFGKQCIAVSLTGESQLWTLARTVPVDVDAPHTDQLGKGLIAYWPNYEWPKDEEQASIAREWFPGANL